MMNSYLAQAVAALQKVKHRESLDECDVAIIDRALTLAIREKRIPFRHLRDHYIIGTERFKALDGFDYYRTILLNRKSDVWYPESSMSELSIFEVYTGSQLEPPQSYNNNPDCGTPDEYAAELLVSSQIGLCFSGSYQSEFDADAIESMRRYVEEVSRTQSTAAVEKKEELEHYLRTQTPGSQFIDSGDLHQTMDAYIDSHHYKGKPRPFYNSKYKVADLVRQATKYARTVLRNNPATAVIADHLEDNVKIGQVCEYRGDWKWRF